MNYESKAVIRMFFTSPMSCWSRNQKINKNKNKNLGHPTVICQFIRCLMTAIDKDTFDIQASLSEAHPSRAKEAEQLLHNSRRTPSLFLSPLSQFDGRTKNSFVRVLGTFEFLIPEAISNDKSHRDD